MKNGLCLKVFAMSCQALAGLLNPAVRRGFDNPLGARGPSGEDFVTVTKMEDREWRDRC